MHEGDQATGCTGRSLSCSRPIPHVRVEKIEGGLLIAGVEIASNCQAILPICGTLFFFVGTLLTVISYQGQGDAETNETYAVRITNSSNSRMMGPICIIMSIVMFGLAFILWLLIRYARMKQQRVCFHCPIHGDFFPVVPVPVSAVKPHKPSLICSHYLKKHEDVNLNPPCPYSNLSSGRTSISSTCPAPKPFVMTSSLGCVQHDLDFWPLTVNHDIASFPVSRTSSPNPINRVENGGNGYLPVPPVFCTTLPEVKLVAPVARMSNRGESSTSDQTLVTTLEKQPTKVKKTVSIKLPKVEEKDKQFQVS